MEEKQSFWKKTEKFLAGKGFYIVLFACAAVIGVSAWIMLFTGKTSDQQEASTVSQTVQSTYQYAADKDDDLDEIAEKPEISTDSTITNATNEQTASLIQQEDESENEEQPDHSQEQETLGFVWPVAGEVVEKFSADELVYNKTMTDWRTHPAVDLAADIGTKVLAAAKGTVETIYDDDLYGATVVIDHGNGLKSIYSNLAASPAVSAGDSVAMGAVIGAVGDTAIGECVEVAHLHFSMTLDDTAVDPAQYLP
jgi:murein DD-endopeptidase MepM/ murein hydrolase activator NlpD